MSSPAYTERELLALALDTARKAGCRCEPKLIALDWTHVLTHHYPPCDHEHHVVELVAAWRMPRVA